MIDRPSILSSATLGLNLPEREPKPYEPCWCGSGVKYKKCHRKRALEAEMNAFAESAKMRAAGKRGTCLHPDGGGGQCEMKSIASHTVQRGGGLMAIAEDGHVLTTFVSFPDIQKANGRPQPKRIGVNDASTFPGFCSTHDSELFKPIEGSSLRLGPKEAFLFMYRALCLEIVRKRNVVNSLPGLKKMDSGMGLQKQIFVQHTMKVYEKGLHMSLEDMEAKKAKADAALEAGDWSNIHYCEVAFDELLPVTTACGFYPEFDWKGQKIQNLLDLGKSPLELSFTITSYGGKSSVIFAWTGELEGPRKTFVDSFLDLPDADKAGRIVAFCFEISENTQIRPSWWQGLAAADAKALAAKIVNGLTQEPHQGSAMNDSAPLGAAVGVKQISKSWS